MKAINKLTREKGLKMCRRQEKSFIVNLHKVFCLGFAVVKKRGMRKKGEKRYSVVV